MEAIPEMYKDSLPDPEGPEGARRATGGPSGASPAQQGRLADPEVPEKPERRHFTAEYKMRILAEVDACETHGEIGALLRREGLYSSHLSRWRKRQREGALGALSPKKRGPAPRPVNPLEKRVRELERENRRLSRKLEAAETIIEVQKKVSALLGIDLETPEESEVD